MNWKSIGFEVVLTLTFMKEKDPPLRLISGHTLNHFSQEEQTDVR